MRRTTTLRSAVLCAVAALALAACGGCPSSRSRTPTPSMRSSWLRLLAMR
jgi:hypothetical protein